MKVKVRGKGDNVKVTDDIRAVVDKVEAKLSRFVSDNAELSVLLSLEGGRPTAEMTLTDKSFFARVEEIGEDASNAVREAGEAMERKLRKYKEKLADRYEGRTTAHTVAQRLGEAISEEEEPDDEPDESDETEEAGKIVRVKRFDVKPMFPEDAALEMEMIGHDFFVFQNAEEHCNVNVIYRRKKGGYGLISPTVE